MEEKNLSCADCALVNCDMQDNHYPDFCLTTHLDDETREKNIREYEKELPGKVMKAAAEVEFEGYCKKTRVEEIIEFAHKINAKKLGIATCVGLIRETRTLTKILRSHGFEVYGVACKAGATPKVRVGIDPKCNAIGENMCNPILQAQLLNEEKTDLNIVVGLCVGHDSLFYRYSDALVTTLIAKDRVLAHNPAAALYLSDTYYNKLTKED